MPLEPLDELYREVVLEHFREPHHARDFDHADVVVAGYNPLCGDRVTVKLKLRDGILTDVAILSRGCAISVASGSMMGDELIGKPLAAALEKFSQFQEMMRGGPAISSEVSDLEALEGVQKFPVRIKCALLPWAAFKEGIEGLKAGKHEVGDVRTE